MINSTVCPFIVLPIQHMREVQPSGPYRLLGYSFGCAVTFEMALQLQAAEEPIDSVILLDGSPAYVTAKYVHHRGTMQMSDDEAEAGIFCAFVFSFVNDQYSQVG